MVKELSIRAVNVQGQVTGGEQQVVAGYCREVPAWFTGLSL
jgi:hypothetical protein